MPPNRADRYKSSRTAWRRLMSANTATAALAAPAPTKTKPSTFVLSTDDFRLARFIFAGTDAANEIIDYQIVGWMKYRRIDSPQGTFWMPRLLAEGAITLGALALGADGADVESAAALIADAVTETIGLPGTDAHSPADDTIAVLELATDGCDLIEVETDLNTAATASVIYQLSDGVW